MSNYKRIGILGGMSPESTADFYSLLVKKHYEKFKDYSYPEIVLFSVNFAEIIELQESKDLDRYTEKLMQGIKSLEAAGAKLIVIASNTPHIVFDRLEAQCSIELLSIPKCVKVEAESRNLRKLLLLGTKYTMAADFYQKAFKGTNINIIVPVAPNQAELNRIIYDELVVGKIVDSSKLKILELINGHDIDGVILGCTELTLIVKNNDSNVAVLDSTDIYADATLIKATL